MIELLTPIWERVLQRSPIGAEDNFFDLGGDPASANRLFAEITRECGRELSPLTIYQAPTIATLAAILEEPAPPKLAGVVTLKSGTKMPPIFLVPGLCSSVMEFFKLAKHFESGHPIFGLQPRGLDGVQEPCDRVEDLAQFYVDAIRAVQPNGPYVLIGYSFGGLVALEMARLLPANGETKALLAVVEAYPFRSFVPLGQRAGIFVRRGITYALKNLRRVGLLSQLSEDPAGIRPDLPEVGEKFTPIANQVCAKGLLAFRGYRPQYYKGKMHFVRSTTHPPHLPDDPIAVWSSLVDELVVETAPGGHWGIITTEFKSLGAVLSGYLKEMPQSEGT
jgi:acetoacetyl-CoA synthetase